MITFKESLCDFCGTCVSVCPHDAIELMESLLIINHETCTECLNCVKVCPLNVLEVLENENAI